ncbi:hypothetical protein BDY17DRAFT_255860 [Neohortaea acidophila]|uniref:Uncharacterized protein n=1 Tax=Neohortaea acidophila TaxID=245834 RepID=A0A6A6PJG0_9PEZI|nr:uncharacterized protein BDY17DRAFT_255860 [Neohortaea acidophila]KAF2480139.1 hypothetical protein BDY17DRAFT_255860 [Neohortaea acidophila]
MAVTAAPHITTQNTTSIADGNLEPFLQPDFDAADYLNSTLPTLSVSSSFRSTQNARAVQLPELSTQLQTLLSQLNAQTSRLSNSLTQLTDEIVRSGGRLAYEVEVLKGEAIGLTDVLETSLEEDIGVLTTGTTAEGDTVKASEGETAEAGHGEVQSADHEPEYLGQLRTLASVRSRLDQVIKVFGEAMQWPIAPSEVSVASSLISVSAPSAGEDVQSREEKGKAYAEKVRGEISDLIGSGNDAADLEAAAARVEELRRLAEVWKGTSEEKARTKFVESLQKLVEDKQKAMGRTSTQRSTALPSRGMDYRYGDTSTSKLPTEGGYGFLQNLRSLKNDVYLE